MAHRSWWFWTSSFFTGVWRVLSWIYFTVSDLLRIPRMFYSKKFHLFAVFLVVVHLFMLGYEYIFYDLDDIGMPAEENFVLIWMTPARTAYGFVVKVLHLIKLFGLDYLKVISSFWLLFNLPFFVLVIQAIICPCVVVPVVAAAHPLWNRVVELSSYWSDPTDTASTSSTAIKKPRRAMPQKKKVRVVEIETPEQSDEESDLKEADGDSKK